MPRDRLGDNLQAKLGRELRAIFSDIASEPSPFDHLPPDRPPPGAPGLREPAILQIVDDDEYRKRTNAAA
jgi:hypothetical protein